MCVFADFWNDFFCGVTSSAAYGSSGDGLPTHCVWATGFYSTAPIPYWIVLFSWSLWLHVECHLESSGVERHPARVLKDVQINVATFMVLCSSSGRRLPCCGAEANPMVFGIPKLPYVLWSMSLLCSCSAFHRSLTCPSVCNDRRRSAEYCGSSAVAVLRSSSTSLSWHRGCLPWSCRPQKFPVARGQGVDVPVMLAVQVSQIAHIPVVVQSRFPWSGMGDHGNSPVARGHGDRPPCCAVAAGSTGAHGPDSAENAVSGSFTTGAVDLRSSPTRLGWSEMNEFAAFCDIFRTPSSWM